MRKLTVLFLLVTLALPVGLVTAQDTTPSITITDPVNNAVLDDPSAIAVTGTATGDFDKVVVVRALDAGGTALTEQTTTTSEAGDWQVTLSVSTPPGTTGQLYAYLTAPEGGNVEAETSISVTYGEVPESSITITSLSPGAMVANDGTIPVAGSATNLFEGALVVQALDSAGTVLDEEPTTAAGAALGGTVIWASGVSGAGSRWPTLSMAML